MTAPVAQTIGITRRFGAKTAVDSLDLTIPGGVVYGLLGPNGSGKTTVMRLLTGLLNPNAGRAEVLGRPLPGNAEALKSQIGYMTQGFTHYRDLTVLGNLRFVAGIHDLPAKRARRRIAELLETYDLTARATDLAGALSSGQRQRLALAATVIHEPQLLFLDEPTAAVDPETRRNFGERLFDLVEAGTTMIVSTHLMDEAERCHRIAILDLDRKCADGTPQDLMAQVEGRVVEVTGDDLRQIGRALKAQTEIASVAQIGARLRVLVSETVEDAEAAVTTALGGRADASARAVRPNLEDVFVLATRVTAR
ncbi:ABC transporter ATP-binding protein [Jannaschia seohaensis]|uniref:ABC-2 type transport system ATP-binding protein n=1 Tax=Jannaschia seohaensis TaxID=475081 RepID=A0A2Y9BZF8_9RHOB|nr:ABC transporter ATP-binding protein [Jannaschia seohaensis]PWJ20262.1 ABC-2 type transport system ATP-binding protein [Jannaschia seohaensis]SSA44272.1 ABC-2 type transport system ATP-binding protein [Jannaschia seohaensis]